MNQLALLVALPLFAAFLLPITGQISMTAARLVGPAVLLMLVSTVWQLWSGAASLPASIALGGFHPPLGITFYVDELALLFALLVPAMALLMWPWTSPDGIRQSSLMLLLVAACNGMALSGDLFNIYVFYELAAVATYGLATDRGTPAGYAAAIRDLFLSAMGSLLALLGITLLYFATGTLNLAQLATLQTEFADPLGIAAFLLLLLGFGVKAELFPLNAWVPEVYAGASRRTAGFLAGLVSKLSVLVLLRMLILLFPQEEARQVLLLLGLLGVAIGEFAAWRALDMVRMLAWSSIGQLGLVFVAFSISGSAGVVAGLAVTLHHLVAKPALFLLAERWGGSLQGLRGAARTSPLAAALFVVFAASLIGLPPLPGFWAKFLVLRGLVGDGDTLQVTAVAVILISTVVEANYLFRTITILYAREGEKRSPPRHAPVDLLTASLLGVLLLAAVAVLEPMLTGLDHLSDMAVDVTGYIQTVSPVVGEP